MAKTLRTRELAGWTTKPSEDIPENRLTAGEVDDNFLALQAESVRAVVQLLGEGLPTRPVGPLVVHWYSWDEPTPDPEHPYDQWFQIQEIVAPPDPGVPAAFTVGQWSVANTGQGGEVAVTITALPSANPEIADIEYRIDGGSAVSFGATTTGSYNVAGLTNDVEVDIEVRAVNAEGNGDWSDVKSVTPTESVVADYLAEVLADSPEVILWDGESTTWEDESGENRDGTLEGTPNPTFISSPLSGGNAIDNSGTGRVRLTSGAHFRPTAAITLEAWIRHLGSDVHTFVVNMHGSGSALDFIGLQTRTGGVARLSLSFGSGAVNLDAGSGLYDEEWHHLVGRYDGSEMAIFIDGVKQSTTQSQSGTMSWTSGSDVFIGRKMNGTAERTFIGEIAAPAIYGTALSDARIAAHFAAGPGE